MTNNRSGSVEEMIYLSGMLREVFLDEMRAEVGVGRGETYSHIECQFPSISPHVAPGTPAFHQIEMHGGIRNPAATFSSVPLAKST